MDNKNKTHISKFLSLILRHKPETIGLNLDENGWADVTELMTKAAKIGVKFTEEELDEVVATNEKKRFAFSEDKTKIRASQGHSVEVNLELKPIRPPEILYHGTVEKFIESITAEGLKKMSRQHVHLSADIETAKKVGGRRGSPVILNVNAGLMHLEGVLFYQSDNGVWLTDHVETKYIKFE